MLFALGRPGDSSATLLITSLAAPSEAKVGMEVDFVFTYRFASIPWSIFGYDYIRSNASLDFGDGTSTPVSFSGLSGSQTFSHTYSEAGSFIAAISGSLSFIDRRWVPRYGRRCYRRFWRTRCYSYYIGSYPVETTLLTKTLTDLSTPIDIHNWEPVARNSDLPQTADATLPEPATLALFGVGLAGLGAAARRRPRRAAEA